MFNITADELPRFMKCNGSRNMPPAPSLDTGDTQARDEGTAAHYMAKAVFLNEYSIDEIIDRKAPNGYYMSAEMADHVGQYLMMLDCGEVEIDTSFGGGVWQVNARADHQSYRVAPEGGTLTTDDLKYGFRLVEPVMNWTLIAHAIGWLAHNPTVVPDWYVFRIHQPRPFHPDGKLREWRISHAQLMELYGILNATLTNPSDTLITGDHCAKCPALGHCPAARAASMNAIDTTSTVFSDTLTSAELSFELDTLRAAKDRIDARLTATENMTMHRLKAGQVIENYATEQTIGNRRWTVDLAMLNVLTGKDLSKPGSVTPAAAERMGVSPDVIKTLTERPPTGQKLVRVTADQRAKRLLGKKE